MVHINNNCYDKIPSNWIRRLKRNQDEEITALTKLHLHCTKKIKNPIEILLKHFAIPTDIPSHDQYHPLPKTSCNTRNLFIKFPPQNSSISNHSQSEPTQRNHEKFRARDRAQIHFENPLSHPFLRASFSHKSCLEFVTILSNF